MGSKAALRFAGNFLLQVRAPHQWPCLTEGLVALSLSSHYHTISYPSSLNNLSTFPSLPSIELNLAHCEGLPVLTCRRLCLPKLTAQVVLIKTDIKAQRTPINPCWCSLSFDVTFFVLSESAGPDGR
ncbi:hypothetical protein PoB_004691200 [Plakobranchus ocellatus]|uniref:Uncharacterized protein n=1 Tax=Plakobranchus ocellatus TaxID=259542 RepID=A0AAV4BM40_9GAST|nr:hypothetical protein PoB_004691200 [Plakobranchus ocellatus]